MTAIETLTAMIEMESQAALAQGAAEDKFYYANKLLDELEANGELDAETEKNMYYATDMLDNCDCWTEMSYSEHPHLSQHERMCLERDGYEAYCASEGRGYDSIEFLNAAYMDMAGNKEEL